MPAAYFLSRVFLTHSNAAASAADPTPIPIACNGQCGFSAGSGSWATASLRVFAAFAAAMISFSGVSGSSANSSLHRRTVLDDAALGY